MPSSSASSTSTAGAPTATTAGTTRRTVGRTEGLRVIVDAIIRACRIIILVELRSADTRRSQPERLYKDVRSQIVLCFFGVLTAPSCSYLENANDARKPNEPKLTLFLPIPLSLEIPCCQRRPLPPIRLDLSAQVYYHPNRHPRTHPRHDPLVSPPRAPSALPGAVQCLPASTVKCQSDFRSDSGRWCA